MEHQPLSVKLGALGRGRGKLWLGFLVLALFSGYFGVQKYRVTHPVKEKIVAKAAERSVASQESGDSDPPANLSEAYVLAFKSVQVKVDELVRIDEENRRLKLENARLRQWGEALRFSCSAAQAESKTRQTSLRLSQETGAAMGRTLASISYVPPNHLLPSQLYTLGVSYMKGGEDEKAAVIFTNLTGLEDNSTYKTAKNYIMTGVAWYHVDHLNEAESYFQKALKMSPTEDVLPYQAQARLWLALIAQQKNDFQKTQVQLRDLLDHHPHSIEAEWVNPLGSEAGERIPAGARDVDESQKKGEEHEGASSQEH